MPTFMERGLARTVGDNWAGTPGSRRYAVAGRTQSSEHGAGCGLERSWASRQAAPRSGITPSPSSPAEFDISSERKRSRIGAVVVREKGLHGRGDRPARDMGGRSSLLGRRGGRGDATGGGSEAGGASWGHVAVLDARADAADRCQLFPGTRTRRKPKSPRRRQLPKPKRIRPGLNGKNRRRSTPQLQGYFEKREGHSKVSLCPRPTVRPSSTPPARQ